MPIDTDDMATMLKAIMQDNTFASTKLPQTAEFKTFFAQLEDEVNNAPEGVMIEVIEELPFGKWDGLIAANEKAREKLS